MFFCDGSVPVPCLGYLGSRGHKWLSYLVLEVRWQLASPWLKNGLRVYKTITLKHDAWEIIWPNMALSENVVYPPSAQVVICIGKLWLTNGFMSTLCSYKPMEAPQRAETMWRTYSVSPSKICPALNSMSRLRLHIPACHTHGQLQWTKMTGWTPLLIWGAPFYRLVVSVECMFCVLNYFEPLQEPWPC